MGWEDPHVSCTRSRETDLAAFVVEPSAAEWAEFRAHYPGEIVEELTHELEIWRWPADAPRPA